MAQEWQDRWQQGRIGFHRETIHPALPHYWSGLERGVGTRVLVPLCGKSHDMRWLAKQGHRVLGVEFVETAIEQFVAEGEGEVTHDTQHPFTITRQGDVELWCGDFFHFPLDHADAFGAFYDRAALIALSEPARQRYAFHLAQLLPPGVPGLLVSLTRAPGDEGGPPYTVTAEEVRELFAANFEVRHLVDAPRDADSGFQESVWQLTRRGPRGH
ncbi:thiopurine S-methyltransferase [Halomonas sp. 18H]|uniref:thiopurine S-methyltransferase n=1 Tax=Halomonas almeriensis TaxID=308163 RepID=UPI00222FD8AD|nr:MULTISPECIES: thiopurine S-methyltransferase [Halomonas]MCW4149363.1 thiopurine S-methyltransferase [Halomonas sp. 18H]MDN3553691.1 thiopurine S-methyltransferase [Halomonas almeriensis]